MDEWGIQNIQFVWFKDSLDGLRVSSMYTNLTSEEADNIQNGRQSSGAPGVSFAAGLLEGKTHQLTFSPGRIDYTVSRPDRQAAGPWAWKLSEGFKILETELENACRATKEIGDTSRLALNVTLLRNVGSAAAAAHFVSERIGGALPANAVDLSVQLNIPKVIEKPDMRYNRLLRFASASVQDMTMSVTNGRPNPVAVGPERHIASLVLDLNTAVISSVYSHKVAEDIFREFTREAMKLSKDGTVAGLVE